MNITSLVFQIQPMNPPPHTRGKVKQPYGTMYIVSGSVQITAFFRFLPVIIQAGLIQCYIFYGQDGGDQLRILLCSQSQMHRQQLHREQSACERDKEAPSIYCTVKSIHIRFAHICGCMWVFRDCICACMNFCAFHVSAPRQEMLDY